MISTAGLGWIGLDWTGLGLAWLGWASLDMLGWAGLLQTRRSALGCLMGCSQDLLKNTSYGIKQNADFSVKLPNNIGVRGSPERDIFTPRWDWGLVDFRRCSRDGACVFRMFLRFSLGTRVGAGDTRGRWGRARALGTRAGAGDARGRHSFMRL